MGEEAGVLLAVEALSLVLLDAHDGAALQEAVVHDVVRLGGQHALDVVADVAEHDAVAVGAGAAGLVLEALDVEALHHRDGELDGGSLGVGEDGSGTGVRWLPRGGDHGLWDGQAGKPYSIAPCVICCAAILRFLCSCSAGYLFVCGGQSWC